MEHHGIQHIEFSIEVLQDVVTSGFAPAEILPGSIHGVLEGGDPLPEPTLRVQEDIHLDFGGVSWVGFFIVGHGVIVGEAGGLQLNKIGK